jgi:hypothetical protein
MLKRKHKEIPDSAMRTLDHNLPNRKLGAEPRSRKHSRADAGILSHVLRLQSRVGERFWIEDPLSNIIPCEKLTLWPMLLGYRKSPLYRLPYRLRVVGSITKSVRMIPRGEVRAD